MAMVEAVAPPKILALKDFESNLRAWEEKVRALKKDFGERLSAPLKMGILTAMCPPSIQDFIYQQGEVLKDFKSMSERVRNLVKNRVSSSTIG